jgi:hypothetical protein
MLTFVLVGPDHPHESTEPRRTRASEGVDTNAEFLAHYGQFKVFASDISLAFASHVANVLCFGMHLANVLQPCCKCANRLFY